MPTASQISGSSASSGQNHTLGAHVGWALMTSVGGKRRLGVRPVLQTRPVSDGVQAERTRSTQPAQSPQRMRHVLAGSQRSHP